MKYWAYTTVFTLIYRKLVPLTPIAGESEGSAASQERLPAPSRLPGLRALLSSLLAITRRPAARAAPSSEKIPLHLYHLFRPYVAGDTEIPIHNHLSPRWAAPIFQSGPDPALQFVRAMKKRGP